MPGHSVTIQGRQLPDGMLYVGSGLRNSSSYTSIDPAFIDAKLPVNNASPDIDGSTMGYWPSYDELTPSARAAYLDWLAAGRPSGAYIGYVFLFFYGIERRLLFDIAKADLETTEVDTLIAEIDRLSELYRDNSSFFGYASEFLSFVKFRRPSFTFSDLDPPPDRRSWDFPLELKIGLGSIVVSETPLPPSWALSWIRSHPETSLRTAAVRCEDEFIDLFKLRYQEIHGPGMMIKRNKTPLSCWYRPASSSLSSLDITKAKQYPDVTRLKRPVRQLQKLAEAVTDELDSYSRWVGRHGDRNSLAAIALLPHELASERNSDDLRGLKAMIKSKLDSREVATILVQDLVAGYPCQNPGAFAAREATAFSGLLEGIGYGIAPDIRYSKVNITKHEYAAVFQLADLHSPPTDRYLAASVLLQLGAAVSAADGTITTDEERVLETHLEDSLQLPAADRTRLRAHLQWLLVDPPELKTMRPRMKALTTSDRSLVARFVVSVAGADGGVSSNEIRVLGRIYELIGLETDQLHRDIHELASTPAAQPVTVIRPDKRTRYRVPSPPPIDPVNAERVELDPQRIAEVMNATRDVSDLLTSIFEDSADPPAPESETADFKPDDRIVPTIDTAEGLLDRAHNELVLILAKRSRWDRSDVEQSAREVGLMLDGAIEQINDVAFQICDEPLIEGDDVLELNEIALRELLNVS